MNKYREYMKNKTFTRAIFFIVTTAALLYIVYFVLRDLGPITKSIWAVMTNLISASSPLWIGLILAYMINPLVEYIDGKFLSNILRENPTENKKFSLKNRSRFISIIITYLIIIFAIIAILYGLAALLLGQIVFTNLTDLTNSLFKMVLNYEQDFKLWTQSLPEGMFSEYAEAAINSIFNWITNTFSASGIINTITGISNGILDFVLGIIVSIYLVSDKNFFIGIWNKFIYLIMPRKKDSLNNTLHEVNHILSQFIRGVLLDSFFVGVLSIIGLTIMGLDFAIFIGLFAGIANVIPYFGPVLGMIPAFLVGTFTESLWSGILAVIILFIVQQIDVNLIYPRVVGSSTGLKPLFVLLAVAIAGHYSGILGMIIAVPTAGIIQLFVIKWAEARQAKIEKKFGLNNTDNDSM